MLRGGGKVASRIEDYALISNCTTAAFNHSMSALALADCGNSSSTGYDMTLTDEETSALEEHYTPHGPSWF